MKDIPTQRNEDYLGAYHTADDHIEEYPEEPEIYTKEDLDKALITQKESIAKTLTKEISSVANGGKVVKGSGAYSGGYQDGLMYAIRALGYYDDLVESEKEDR